MRIAFTIKYTHFYMYIFVPLGLMMHTHFISPRMEFFFKHFFLYMSKRKICSRNSYSFHKLCCSSLAQFSPHFHTISICFPSISENPPHKISEQYYSQAFAFHNFSMDKFYILEGFLEIGKNA